MAVLEVALDPSTVIVAVDPGKAFNRVWISNGSGLRADPMSLPVSREGIAALESALNKHGPGDFVIAIEATGSLHRPWVAELERRHHGSMPLFAPSETISARTHLGSDRFKTDDRRRRATGDPWRWRRRLVRPCWLVLSRFRDGHRNFGP